MNALAVVLLQNSTIFGSGGNSVQEVGGGGGAKLSEFPTNFF